jgi:hypothetical protein
MRMRSARTWDGWVLCVLLDRTLSTERGRRQMTAELTGYIDTLVLIWCTSGTSGDPAWA